MSLLHSIDRYLRPFLTHYKLLSLFRPSRLPRNQILLDEKSFYVSGKMRPDHLLSCTILLVLHRRRPTARLILPAFLARLLTPPYLIRAQHPCTSVRIQSNAVTSLPLWTTNHSLILCQVMGMLLPTTNQSLPTSRIWQVLLQQFPMRQVQIQCNQSLRQNGTKWKTTWKTWIST